MRWIDWLFVLGIVALVLGPLLTLRWIARIDARVNKLRPKTPPRTQTHPRNDAYDDPE